ncbi:hypothetical protein AUEXF2481DRAFT_197824 [Aureobasidium subglaciale EXF-2481]|uniref:Transcription factor TFIIIC triple barrel domain-containing protein n=1 Tax=Aureobasidium subglaciale (strain EXF-2481) TaxID=1043005 RepID=A0A074YPT3_AURSE|nr:uncharacterized protein AUEXF2481DRAFT_197824 [Aureobasidium subglaciale EXF-2481]KAI5211423.1 hypothetical protein E4T38_01501 [Aureobasidium subglaciale]KAI5229789.1 hypothetical protein E4T40_01502 [Aureobasidium subglaciale]KAI5233400.1 hypothetical protein E4T41_01499 [Aureobasidium subglaciale]KAI5266575.1 hypothetical protein E4T46_01501 [Aureobasidium subglaciale]KEQ99808.1 hypothetical protein AUEXF2481DRAFT_197824 [Aureobasidium subglaciale EXF-2481]
MTSTNMAGSEDESEWEYEYDTNVTDDFYVTIDLTTHIPPALARDRRAKAQKTTTRGSNKSLANAPGTGNESGTKDGATQNDDGQDADTTTERMQIVGLHDRNPIISYNNAIYSCQWATDLATQIFLTPPPSDFDPDYVALRSTPSYDVLGTSAARVVAIPASIQPRVAAVPNAAKAATTSAETTYTTAEGDVIEHTTAQGLRISLPSTASAQRTSQAKFLEALSAIKSRRGDQDAVPVTNIKVYHPPEGWEEERADYIEKESARSKKDKAEAAARAKREKAEQTARLTRLNRRPAYARPNPDEEAEEDGSGDENEDDTNKDGDADGNKLVTRKRRTLARGGSRGGAPSGKRLRQSLGLPEARRDARPKGRPRKKRKLAEVPEDIPGEATEDTTAEAISAVSAGPSRDGTSAQAEQEDTNMTEGGAIHDDGSATQND